MFLVNKKSNVSLGFKERNHELERYSIKPIRNIKKGGMLSIIITSSTHIRSFVKGYHVHKHWWIPVTEEHLITQAEPSNPVDKYAVGVNKNDLIVGHLPLSKNGKLSKTIFYSLRADRYATCKVVITGKIVDLGDGDCVQVVLN